MSYAQQLIDAYEGEVNGAVFFPALQSPAFGEAQNQSLRDLGVLEGKTMRVMQSLVRRHALAVRSVGELEETGRREAEGYRQLSWLALNQKFVDDFAIYVDHYRDLRDAAEPEDRAALELLYQHEVALIDFCRDESQGHPGSRHLVQYLTLVDDYLATAA